MKSGGLYGTSSVRPHSRQSQRGVRERQGRSDGSDPQTESGERSTLMSLSHAPGRYRIFTLGRRGAEVIVSHVLLNVLARAVIAT